MKEEEMTNMPNIVVGLDIGTTKIATIIGYKGEDKIDVIGHGKGDSTGVQHGLIYNINKTVDGINVSKEQAENRTDCFKVNKVFVGIAGRHIKSIEYKHVITRFNGKDFVIKQEEIDKMLKDLYSISVPSGERIITVIPQHYVVDGIDTTEPAGMLGELIEGYYQLITGNESEIKKILLCVENAGLKAEDIILEPIASGLSCLSEEEKNQGVALVDIGGGTTDLAIYCDGSPVFTKVIPIGGTIITRDIATVCQVTEELAEKLKVTCGTCIVEKSNANHYVTLPQFHAAQPPRQINETYLAKIINMRVQNDILDQVKREIDNSGYADRLRAGVVLTGGGATLKHIKELCQYTLQKPVRIGIPEYGFVRNIPNDLKHPMYSTALGLLKYGIEKTEKAEETVVEKESPKKETPEPITKKTVTACGLFVGTAIFSIFLPLAPSFS